MGAQNRRAPGRWRCDAGAVALEGAVVAPVVILATMVIVQIALYFIANTAATNAAQIAAESARVSGASADLGESAGRDYLQQVGGLEDPAIDVSRSPASVTATVTADAPSVVPFVSLPQIKADINAPVERVTTP